MNDHSSIKWFIRDTLTSTANWLTSHHGHSQADVGMRRQHVDVVLTQGVDDDCFAPVNQMSCNLKDLREKINCIKYK